MSGKYNQVLVVRYSRRRDGHSAIDAHLPGDAVQSVTPHRQSLLIPFHLQEIRAWLRPGRGHAHADKLADSCERRLKSALLMSHYDPL
jgi:hypothetical protein